MITTLPYYVTYKKSLLTYCIYAASVFFARALSGLVLIIFTDEENDAYFRHSRVGGNPVRWQYSVSKLTGLDRVFFRLTGVVQCAASLDSRLRGNDEVEI